ncbi:MAG: hypothetical protein ACYCYE_03915 [Clostridia bacterium]
MPEFTAIAGENPKPDVLIKFIDKNISGVSTKDASTMLGELEKAQKNYLPYWRKSIITIHLYKKACSIFTNRDLI